VIHRDWCRGVVLAAALMVMLLTTIGCGNKSNNNQPTPPTLPPQSSFLMSFTGFTASSNSPTNGGEVLSRVNWGQSAVRVGFWNLALTVTLAVPTAAFLEAFNHQPVLQNNGSWAWTYNVTIGVVYTCRLVGKIANSEIQWNMYISKEGQYTDYLWYYGSHNLLATQGSWTVNRDPSQTNPFLGIDWHYSPTAGTGDLRYTNIIPGDTENGSYIFYSSIVSAGFDRFYHIYSISQDNLTEIEWNHTSLNGRVKDQNFYGDSNWHCWDENQNDIICP
jgi:hypothetical protein